MMLRRAAKMQVELCRVMPTFVKEVEARRPVKYQTSSQNWARWLTDH